MIKYYLDRSIVILGEDILFDLPMRFTLTFQIYNKKYKPPVLTIQILQNYS